MESGHLITHLFPEKEKVGKRHQYRMVDRYKSALKLHRFIHCANNLDMEQNQASCPVAPFCLGSLTNFVSFYVPDPMSTVAEQVRVSRGLVSRFCGNI